MSGRLERKAAVHLRLPTWLYARSQKAEHRHFGLKREYQAVALKHIGAAAFWMLILIILAVIDEQEIYL